MRHHCQGLLLLSVLAGASLATAPAATAQSTRKAEVVEKMSVGDLEKLVKGMGFDVEHSKDGKALLFRVNGYRASVVSYGANMQFTSYFDGKQLKPERASADHMNKWNAKHRFSRAYIDQDGDAAIEYDVDMEGGVTLDNLRVAVNTFRDVATVFSRHLLE